MSKGLIYSGIDDPRLSRSLVASWERRASRAGKTVAEYSKDFIESHNAQWAIVGKCARCGRDLIAGEDINHLINHLPAKLRPLARDLQKLSATERAELMDLLDEDGRFLEAPDA